MTRPPTSLTTTLYATAVVGGVLGVAFVLWRNVLGRPSLFGIGGGHGAGVGGSGAGGVGSGGGGRAVGGVAGAAAGGWWSFARGR